MPGEVEWGADGTPRSARFDDRYRPAEHGLEQAQHVFLSGCGLPGEWAGHAHWTILETGFGLGLNFLAAWQAWREDPRRPRILHFVSIEAHPVSREDILRSVAQFTPLRPLADALATEWYGLLPGIHRMSFEGGRVLLTLCVGDVHDMLRQLVLRADSVFLDGFDPRRNPQMWNDETITRAARLCRRGARAATWTVSADVRRSLAQQGFAVEKAPGLPPKRDCLRAVYDPAWQPKGLQAAEAAATPGRCAVVGGGLAGAAVASSLARRGWRVTVFDAAAQPAAGASSLPAGLLAPHQSPDDNLLSRLSRGGVRMTLAEARRRLGEGDWSACGVLERRVGDARALRHQSEWSRDASRRQKQDARLGADSHAWWHEAAAWIRPAALVRSWLADDGIEWRGNAKVQRLSEVASFDLVVIAAALATGELMPGQLELHPVRGQVSWGRPARGEFPFPVNGHGHFIPAATVEGEPAWLVGSTYGRADATTDIRIEDHASNLQKLRDLLPEAAALLSPEFAGSEVQAWTGVRCASRDRRPLVGEVRDGVWVSTAMGSRGLTFSVLCAELLASRLHGEPLPLAAKEAGSLDVARQRDHVPRTDPAR